MLLEPVDQGRTVIVVDGQLWIIDQGFIPEQLMFDLVLSLLRKATVSGTLIVDRKGLWILSIALQGSEKEGFPNS